MGRLSRYGSGEEGWRTASCIDEVGGEVALWGSGGMVIYWLNKGACIVVKGSFDSMQGDFRSQSIHLIRGDIRSVTKPPFIEVYPFEFDGDLRDSNSEDLYIMLCFIFASNLFSKILTL